MSHDKRNIGFTLVELMLAMGFVAALLLSVAMTVVQMGNIYNRGLTYKSVNQAGSTIVSELQRSVGGVARFDLATHFVQQGPVNNYIGGRLCVGQFSYIWNYGKAFNSPANTYSDSPNIIRFIKAMDPDSSYCLTPAKKVPIASAVELLDVGQVKTDLAVHYFTISSSVSDSTTGQQLYSIEFVIGTNYQNALNVIVPADTNCRPPSDLNSDLTYCAVNKFDIVARAGKASQK